MHSIQFCGTLLFICDNTSNNIVKNLYFLWLITLFYFLGKLLNLYHWFSKHSLHLFITNNIVEINLIKVNMYNILYIVT